MRKAPGTQSVRIEGSGQHVDYTEHYVLPREGFAKEPHVLRVHVHVDSYADQAYGTVERWDSAQWREVVRVRGVSLLTDLKIGYGPAARRTPGAFLGDRDRLLALAKEVLS